MSRESTLEQIRKYLAKALVEVSEFYDMSEAELTIPDEVLCRAARINDALERLEAHLDKLERLNA